MCNRCLEVAENLEHGKFALAPASKVSSSAVFVPTKLGHPVGAQEQIDSLQMFFTQKNFHNLVPTNPPPSTAPRPLPHSHTRLSPRSASPLLTASFSSTIRSSSLLTFVSCFTVEENNQILHESATKASRTTTRARPFAYLFVLRLSLPLNPSLY